MNTGFNLPIVPTVKMAAKQTNKNKFAAARKLVARSKVGMKFANRLANSDMVTNAVNDLRRVATALLTDTTFVAFLCVAMWLQYQHSVNKMTIVKYVQEHSGAKFYDWVNSHVEKLVGFMTFLPVFVATKSKVRNTLIVFVAGTLWLLPTLTQPEYMIMAFCLLLYVKCTRKSTRMVLILVLLFYAYFLDKGTILSRIVHDLESVITVDDHRAPPSQQQQPVPAASRFSDRDKRQGG